MSATAEAVPQTAIALRVPVETGLSDETAASLKEAFASYFERADEWRQKAVAIRITDASQTREMKLARETRLALREIRVEAEKTRKQLKEDSLRKGKAIDGIYNMLEFAIKPLEEHLHEQEKFVERAEEERKARLAADRTQQLLAYGVDCTLYQLGEITEESFANLLETNRLAHAARIGATRRAEADRIERERAQAEERERVRLENERLKVEAAKREAAMAEERKKAEADRAAAEAKARKEREALETKARAEREAAEAVAKQERAAREKAEAELRAKQQADAAAKAAEEKAKKAAARAPDKTKILGFAKAVRGLPAVSAATPDGAAVVREITEKVEWLAQWIESKAAAL